MIGVSRFDESANVSDGLRPINLRTDLAALADLIELAFATSMDSGGRAALREMRYLSRVGAGLNFLARMNDLAMGVSLGYVWVADGRLVGNVSVYPANLPRSLGSRWILANVAVHPDYQRRGIARQLMLASMEMIRRRKGTAAILQVDADNDIAIHLYRSLGFFEERTWTTWRRNSTSRFTPPRPETEGYVRHRRRHEWRDEMEVAQTIRPQQRGGLGWLRPLHVSQFRSTVWKRISDWLNLRGTERLTVYSEAEDRLLGSLWIDTNYSNKTRLTLLVEPTLQGLYDDVLLNTVVRRYYRAPLTLEQPDDETATIDVLRKYQFVPQRGATYMRWDVR